MRIANRVAALAACGLLFAARAAAAQSGALDEPFFTARYDPRLQFRTIRTARFDIHYHQREEAIARRLARIVEDVARDVDARLGAPRARVQVILVDQSDQSNGWATVIPYNAIEITAAPPRSQSFIGNTDDWLRMVFTHEYTHVVHLEKSGGWLGSLRHVFGRQPLFYPNVFLPEWQIEGLATYHESALTQGGRVRAPDFRMLLDRAAAADRFAPLDRASGGVVDWPSGNRPYLYGAYFHQYLADRFGEASIARLTRETADRLPLFGSRAFRSVYGQSLGSLWNDFRADAARRAVEESARAERLTHHGFVVASPAFSAGGRLFYSMSNPDGFPALMELSRTGTGTRTIATRFRGNRLTAAGELLVFDQLEAVHNVDVQSDLYVVPIDGGHTRRLTKHARAADPDVSPDGRTIVCTVQQSDRRLLATLDLRTTGRAADPTPLVSEPATEFSSPRWSPDGRSIVAERRRLHGPSELVVIDVASRALRTLVESSPARSVSPVWLPDGRTILFSSDRDGPFSLYAVDVNTRRLRHLAGTGAAQSPAMSPDGRELVFVGYSADGYDLYSVPMTTAEWKDVAAPVNHSSINPEIAEPKTPVADRPYRPWATLTPRFWSPVIESGDDDLLVGATTAGLDTLGRHGYAVTAAWSIDRQRPEWEANYTYARWWPAVFAGFSDDTDSLSSGEFRSRELNAGALFPVRRVRWTMRSLAAFHVADERLTRVGSGFSRTRSALRAGWSVSSAKSYGYSISTEEGASLRLGAEMTRRALGADGNGTAAIADARGYARVFPRHAVIAARIAAASSWGDEAMRRPYSVGGPGPQGSGFNFGVDAIGLLRGFDESDLVGDHAAVVNIDYRFPLAWVERGHGTVPILLRSFHGAAFADAGGAWDATLRRSNVRTSVGAELSCDLVVGDTVPLTVTAGVAWQIDGTKERRAVAFGRIGRAF